MGSLYNVHRPLMSTTTYILKPSIYDKLYPYANNLHIYVKQTNKQTKKQETKTT